MPHNDLRDAVVKKAWDQAYENDDHLLFASRKTNVDLSTLHPPQNQIFKLWQMYLDNVSPLLKVTHTPTLQGQIIDAASDMGKISPALEALMFGIYCVTISSLEDEQCRSLFGLPKKDSLTGYQFGCQQALLNCGVLRTSNRDCLTALLLYIVCFPWLYYKLATNVIRSRLDLIQTLGLCPQCLGLLCVLRNAWGSSMSRHMASALLSRLRCAEDYGGP